MKPTFESTVDILVKAYFNGTLRHGNCYACAVGNLVACGLGTKVIKDDTKQYYYKLSWANGMDYPGMTNDVVLGWAAAFSTDREDGRYFQQMNLDALNEPIVRQQIEATGYKWQELARIEYAFESVDPESEDRMFNGLMAVLDVLADIHNIDLTEKEEAKKLFVKL